MTLFGKHSRNAQFQPDCMGKPIIFDFTGGRVKDSTAIRLIVYAIVFCFVMPYGPYFLASLGGDSSAAKAFLDSFMEALRLDQSALHGQWWRFVTYLFLHAGLLHVLFNLGALVGLYMIAKVQFPKYVWLLAFFLAGITGGLSEILLNPDIPGVVGASAGVFGLWGAALVSAWRYTRLPFDERPLGNQQNLHSLTVWLFINFILGLLIPSIAKYAHAGGLAAGMIIGIISPICGQPRLLATREGLFVVEKSKGLQERVKKVATGPVYLIWIKLLPTEEFDPSRDALIAEYDSFRFNNERKVRYELVAGAKLPANYENLVEVATPLKISVPGAGDSPE